MFQSDHTSKANTRKLLKGRNIDSKPTNNTGKSEARIQTVQQYATYQYSQSFYSCNNDLDKQHNYNSRHKTRPNIPVANSKLYQTSFLMQALRAYDKLPKEIVLVKNIKNFSMKCKVKLLQQN